MPTRTETGKEGLVDNASERMQEAASVAQDKAADLRERGSAQVRDQFDRRSTQAGAQVRSLAEALRRSGDELSKEGNSGAARITGQAAERIEQVGSHLEEKSGDELVRDIETFARKRPWMLAGLGLLSGVAAAHEGVIRPAVRQLPRGAPTVTDSIDCPPRIALRHRRRGRSGRPSRQGNRSQRRSAREQ